ncbi:ABC transporter substrate-binding protein [Glaciihabitans sp. dw_435]|uniref:ABC transporter substrate-binding protein n=1 Tax=Glaciihabitans sp. dw_435 TaxID=2720081 RepID=UPI001BD32922|nr:ABC transporter substrate-binding protein [Glaciihabitans sp. dw_435]
MTFLPKYRGRSVLAVAALVTAALALSGCASGSSTSDTASSSSTTWSFTDDLGKTVTLDHKPTTIVGQNETMVSLMNYGVNPIGTFGSFDITQDARYKDLDVTSITQIGTEFGAFDLEALAALQPDLIIADVYPVDEKGTIDATQPDFGFSDLEQQKQIEKIAPIVTVVMGGDGADVIDSIVKLSTALGADDDTLATAKAAYDNASSELKQVAEESKLTVATVYADADGYYVVKADEDPALDIYKDLGVDFIEPTPEGYYWGIYSWENAGKVGGDLILLNQSGYQQDELSKQPTLANTAAIKSGQVYPWLSAGLDYVSQASYMKQLAGYLGEAKVVTD